MQLTVGAQEIAGIPCSTANSTGGSVRSMSSRNTSRAAQRADVSSGMPQLINGRAMRATPYLPPGETHMAYEVVLNRDERLGHAHCVALQISQLDDDVDFDFAVLRDETPSGALRAPAEASAHGCPAPAELVEDQGR